MPRDETRLPSVWVAWYDRACPSRYVGTNQEFVLGECRRHNATLRDVDQIDWIVTEHIPASDLAAAEARIVELASERDGAVEQWSDALTLIAELEPLAKLAREIGEAWSASREAFRIICKSGALAHNERMPTEAEYEAIQNRAYRSIDKAVELHRAAKETGQ